MKRCFTKKVSKWLIHWKYPQPHCFSGTHKLKTVMWFHYTLNRKAKIDRIEWGPECRTSRTFRQCRKECSWVAAQLCFLLKLQNRVQLFCDSMDCRPLGSSGSWDLPGKNTPSVQFSSVQLLSHVQPFATPWTTARQASLSITNCWSLPKPMSIELVRQSNHLILRCPLRLQPSIFPSIKVFSNESSLRIRWPKYWSFSFNISPSSEHPGLICVLRAPKSSWHFKNVQDMIIR